AVMSGLAPFDGDRPPPPAYPLVGGSGAMSSEPQQQQQKPIEDVLDDEDKLEDETVAERILALAEMFPKPVRSAASGLVSGSFQLTLWSFRQASNLAWVATTTGLIALLPLIIERERVGVEEAELENERKMMLGPASASAAGQPAFAHA
ncbi:hypothetical protein BOX15_Mlig024877g1, partial [Macrostomum lignano]